MSDGSGKVSYLGADEGDILNFFGGLFIFKVRSHQTGGAFALFEAEIPGQSRPPKMHTHPAAEPSAFLPATSNSRLSGTASQSGWPPRQGPRCMSPAASRICSGMSGPVLAGSKLCSARATSRATSSR